MKSVIIIGASGHGKVIADIILKSKDKVYGFLDDNENLGDSFCEFPILGKVDEYKTYISKYEFIIAIGNANIREAITNKMTNAKWYTAIHPTAVISNIDVVINEGTTIMANAVINSSASIGKHCIINTSAVVEHDNMIADYVHISVGAKLAGAVVVDNIVLDGTYVGIPAVKIVTDK